MLAVEGIYENGQIHFLEKLPALKRARVIVTIIETFQESDTDQENTDPHIFDDLIGAIDACEDGSVRHNHHINALTAIRGGKYARPFRAGEPLSSEIFAASKQKEKELEERRRTL